MLSNDVVLGGLLKPIQHAVSNTYGVIIPEEILPIASEPRRTMAMLELADNHTRLNPYGSIAGTMLEIELSPIAQFLIDVIQPAHTTDDDSGVSTVPHFVRGATICDMLLSTRVKLPPSEERLKLAQEFIDFHDPEQVDRAEAIIRYPTESELFENPFYRDNRSLMQAHLARFHKNEVFPDGSYEDEVKRRLFGPDLDLVVEIDPEEIRERFISGVENYYQNYYLPNQRNEGDCLECVLHHESPDHKVDVFRINSSQSLTSSRGTAQQLKRGEYEPQDTFLAVTLGKQRSGIPYLEIAVCIKKEEDAPIRPHIDEVFDRVFSVGMSPYRSLESELQAQDARLGPHSNSWDAYARATLTLNDVPEFINFDTGDFGGNKSPTSCLQMEIDRQGCDNYTGIVLTEPIEHGEQVKDMDPVRYFEEVIRIVRKSIIYEDNLAFSETGREHIKKTRKKRRYSSAIADETWDIIQQTLNNEEYRTLFQSAWKKLSKPQKEYLAAKCSSEIITMFTYDPEKTWLILNDLGLRYYFPALKKIKGKHWEQVQKKLPGSRQHKYAYTMALNPNEKAIRRWAREITHAPDSSTRLRQAERTMFAALGFQEYRSILDQLEHALFSFRFAPDMPTLPNYRGLKRILRVLQIPDERHGSRGLETAIHLFTLDPTIA